MATFTLEVKVGDAVQVLELIEVHASDPTPFMLDVLLVMIRSTQLTFEAEGRPDRWDDLAESTERRRFRRAKEAIERIGSLGALGSIMILRDTGMLWQSVGGSASGPFSEGEGFGEADAGTAVIGTSHPGGYNQLPDTRGRRPIRTIFLWQDQDVEDVTQMGMDFLLGAGPYGA